MKLHKEHRGIYTTEIAGRKFIIIHGLSCWSVFEEVGNKVQRIENAPTHETFRSASFWLFDNYFWPTVKDHYQ